MKITPNGDRILVKILKIDTTSGGIIVPDRFQLISSFGEVVAVGPGYLSDEKTNEGKDIWEPLESKVGDQIVFFKQAGVALSENFKLIHDKDVLATINDKGFDIGDMAKE